MKHLVAIAVAVFVVTAALDAAAVDGNWAGTVDTPDGAVQVTFTFRADGGTLSGSSTGPDGSVMQIKNGKIDGDKISFTIDFDFGGMPFTLPYTGVVMPDQINLTIDLMGMPLEFVVKRAK